MKVIFVFLQGLEALTVAIERQYYVLTKDLHHLCPVLMIDMTVSIKDRHV